MATKIKTLGKQKTEHKKNTTPQQKGESARESSKRAKSKSKRSKMNHPLFQQENKEKIATALYVRKQNKRSFSPANREAARKSNKTNLAQKNRKHLFPNSKTGGIALSRRRGPGYTPQ
ncbi:hypothetical protein [Companilactobacillus zhongbaensis]|uniref:hypothetical protein n=1 Tax=Companilactobacillus zhongbaensis TaxID=2486009 RepID=UPI0013DDA8CA|nr:hypothetical protein [Companilactobacillus zhongbaensis]